MCLSCGGQGVPGRVDDYCPHGRRRPYRGWPCARCREETLALADGGQAAAEQRY